MISAPEGDPVIIHIPVREVCIRVNGADKRVFDLSQGFAHLEYSDGNIFQTSNPLKQWFIDVVYNSTQAIGSTFYFVFDSPGYSNPGDDDSRRSLIDDVIGL